MNPDIQPVSSPWVTDDRGHVRLASPPATLPGPAQPGLAYPDPMWAVRRLGIVEKHRQGYADEVARKDAEIAGYVATICHQSTESRLLREENARLRTHLAAAGLALDELTGPEAARRAVDVRLAAGDDEGRRRYRAALGAMADELLGDVLS